MAKITDQKWDGILGSIDRRKFLVTSLAAGTMTLAPRMVSAAAGEDYNLGVLLPSTGAGANWAESAIKSINIAVADINARGGLLGKHPIRIHYRDTQTKPDVTTREGRSIILDEKVGAIIGTYSSACALALQEITYEAKVLQLASISNSATINGENFSPYTFQFGPNTRMMASAIVIAVEKLAKENGWKNYVTIGQDYEWGRGTQAGFVDGLKTRYPEAGLQRELWFKLGETDLGAYISGIMAQKPDFVFPAIAGKDARTFMEQGQAMGMLHVTSVVGGQITTVELQQQKDTLPRGLVGVSRCAFFAHLDEPVMQKYIEMYRKAENAYPTDMACMNFDVVYGLEQAVEKAGSIETEAIKKALTGATLKTGRGERTFRTCDNQLNVPTYIGQVYDDPEFDFPIYKRGAMIEVAAEEVWGSCEEVSQGRKQRG
ncbi:ABC transporter substrate-binding protein [Roseibium sp. M-1]